MHHDSRVRFTMCITGSQRTAFQIAKLVEHKDGIMAGADKVVVGHTPLLFAVGRADAGIHVQHDEPGRTAGVNTVDPSAALAWRQLANL